MAASGYFNTGNYQGRYLQFSWKEESQNVANNTTTISWTLKGAGTAASGWYEAGNFKVVIAGTTVFSQTKRIQLWNGTTVASGTYTLAHNADGTKSFTASAEGGIWYVAVNCRGSGTFTLDTIPRASQPSCITYPNHTQNVGEFGDTISIHTNRNSSAFTHTVRYAFGSKSGTCINAETGKAATGIGTGFRWKVPEELMDLIPANTSGSGTIYVDTYNGSTKIGTKSCGFTAAVPATVKPTCSFVLDDVTKVDEIYGKPVKGLSKIKVTVSSELARSSPIASCKITANGVTYSGTTATTDLLKTAGTSRVTATVTDKRGRSGSVSYDMTVLDYSAPQITSLNVRRGTNSSGGDYDNNGKYANVDFSVTWSEMDEKNGAAFKVYAKKSTETSYVLMDEYGAQTGYCVFPADPDSSYDIKLVVIDKHNTVERQAKLSTAFTLTNYHPSGTGIRFGGVAEEKNTFQNDLIFVQTANQYSFSSVGTASTDGFILMARITITETNSDTPLTFVFSRRKAAAPMTVHIRFASTADTDPALESIKYEGENYDAYLTKSAASVWDLYVRKVSNSDTITLNRWHTSYRQMKRCTVDFVGSIASQVPTGLVGYYKATPLVVQSIIDCFMPVGFILTLYSNTADPNNMYPGTEWVRIENAFLWGCDSTGIIGLSGGEKTHTLTVDEIPAHTHGSVYSQHATGTKDKAWYTASGSSVAYGTVSTGSGAEHNNMPPYVQVAIWRRTA